VCSASNMVLPWRHLHHPPICFETCRWPAAVQGNCCLRLQAAARRVRIWIEKRGCCRAAAVKEVHVSARREERNQQNG
jgi:hypothetical protein